MGLSAHHGWFCHASFRGGRASPARLAGPAAFLTTPTPCRPPAILYRRGAPRRCGFPARLHCSFGEKSGFAKIQGFTYKKAQRKPE